jgi:hypothetical protein
MKVGNKKISLDGQLLLFIVLMILMAMLIFTR